MPLAYLSYVPSTVPPTAELLRLYHTQRTSGKEIVPAARSRRLQSISADYVRQGNGCAREIIDASGFYAFVDDFDRSGAGYHLREAIENACVDSRHLLLARKIRPADRREHQQIPRCTLVEELAPWLVQRRKALVRKRNDLMTCDKGPSRDFTLTLADAGRNQHRAMSGLFKQRLTALAERCGLDARRRVFQNATLHIARVSEETARALHLQNRGGLQKMMI